MASLVSMANSVFEYLENFHLDPSRCVKARSPLSKCSACIDICPVQGIKWTGKRVEINECIECSLCSSVCPSGGIVYNKISPLKVIKEAQKILLNFNEVFIYCSRNTPEKPIEQGIEVPCLGFFTWESWLSLSFYDQVKIYHSFAKCENCQVKGGPELINKGLSKNKVLMDKKPLFLAQLNKDGCNEGKLEELQYDKGKREFLGTIFKSFVKIPETIISTVIGFPNSSGEKLSERNEILLNSIAINPDVREKVLISLPKIKEGCQFCRVCSTLCPQKALAQQEAGDGYKIILDKKLCDGCQLCVDVCFHQAIKLESAKVKELEEDISVLAEGSEFICTQCGMPYRSKIEDKCINCKTKGL